MAILFDGLPDGTYILKCTFIDYSTPTITISVKGDETKIVRLNPSTHNLDEVVLTSAPTQQETMTTINKIDIELRPLKSSEDVLRMIPRLNQISILLIIFFLSGDSIDRIYLNSRATWPKTDRDEYLLIFNLLNLSGRDC